MKFAFFGTSHFSKIILEKLKEGGLVPSLIITTPDKPKGRGLKLTESEVKIWAKENGIEVLQPEKLDGSFILRLSSCACDIFIVASYGKIIPKEILELPKYKSINVHPSLLPRYRGASPLQGQILNDEKEIGTTIMLMDEKMDHGPILDQTLVNIEMPLPYHALEEKLAEASAELLVKVLPAYINGQILPQEQDHDQATFCKMIKKEDGLLDMSADPYKNYLKFLAFGEWPGVYYFQNIKDKDARIKITEAEFENEQFVIKRVIPEGRKEMNYENFVRGLKT